MNQVHQTPTGPIYSYQAIPFPLLPEQQMELRILSEAIRARRRDHQQSMAMRDQDAFDRTKTAVRDADAALDAFTEKLRESSGVLVTRREFLSVTGSLDSAVEVIRRNSLPELPSVNSE